MKTKSLPFREALLSSGVMAFAGMGDALLYSVLPIYGKSMGFSVFSIGMLLSINRYIRIVSNTLVANIINDFGMKKVLVVTSVLAVLTTFFYGLKLGLLSFLIARIIWGLSYSGLKMATLNYAGQLKKKAGLAFGLTKGIKTMGAFFALWAGPVLIDAFDIQIGLFTIAFIGSIGVVLAFLLRTERIITKRPLVKTRKTFDPNAINLLVFVLSIAIDGILVVTLASLLSYTYTDNSTLLVYVSFYLLIKRLFVLVLSFVSGFLSLKVQLIKLFNISVVFCILALLLVSLNFVVYGIMIAFMFNTFIVTFSPLIAIQRQREGENSLQALSGISTWWDLGAATGAFLGIFLIEKVGNQVLFLVLSLSIAFLFVNFYIKNATTDRETL